MLDKGSELVEKNFNIEKIIKGLRNLKILMKQQEIYTKDKRSEIDHDRKNLINLDSSDEAPQKVIEEKVGIFQTGRAMETDRDGENLELEEIERELVSYERESVWVGRRQSNLSTKPREMRNNGIYRQSTLSGRGTSLKGPPVMIKSRR